MLFSARGLLRFCGAAVVVVVADYLPVLTDCVIAGRVLGERELGALNLLSPVFSAVTFFAWILASGLAAATSSVLRKGDRSRAAALAGQGICVAVLASGVLLVATRVLENPYLAFMAPDDSITDLTGAFWRWYDLVIGLQPLYMTLMCLSFVNRGELACIISYSSMVALNVVLSYALALRMGIAGISLGTVLSCAVGLCVIALALVWRHPAVPVSFRMDLPGLFYSLRTSLSDSLIWIFHAVLFLAIAKYVIVTQGSDSLPICAVVFCIIRLATFFGGIGIVLRPLERQREASDAQDGAKRAFRIAAAISFAVMAVASVVFFVAPELVIGTFGIETAELVVDAKLAARLTVVALAAAVLVAILPLVRRVRDGRLPESPLSYLQTYVLARIAEDGETRMFNLAKLFRLRKGIDLNRLADALVAAGRSHAAFRTVLRRGADGEPVQRLELGEETVTCPVVKADEADLLAHKEELVRPFPIFGGKLFEARIFDCGERAYLLSDFHHLICDGYSFPLILEDAHRAWNGEALAADSYYEVLQCRKSRAESPVAVTGRAFMREVLRSRRFTCLPADDFRGPSGYGTLEMPLTLPNDFESFLSGHRVTRHHVFLAAAARALRLLTGDDDILIDWVFHGRVTREELKTVGAFMVDLPLVFDATADTTAAEVLALVKRSTFNGIKGVSFYRSAEDCNPTGQGRLTFIYQDEWGELMTSGPVREDGPFAWMIEETIPLQPPGALTENPFNVEIMEHRDATRLYLEYDPGRYAETTVRRYARLFEESLNWLMEK